MDSHAQLRSWMHSQAVPLPGPLPSMADTLQMPLLQSDRPRLTSSMIAEAKLAFDDFAAH